MIPNISKGKGVSGAIAYALGEGNDPETKQRRTKPANENSRAQILGGQNFGFDVTDERTLDIARRIMEDQAREHNQHSKTARCDNDCLHMSLSWNKGEHPGKDEMIEAARSALKALGMENAQAVFITHTDTDHPHLHIIASRIDYLTGKAFSQAGDFVKAQEWALQWEEEHEQIGPAREEIHALRAAVKAQDVGQFLSRMTARNPTFTSADLTKAIRYGGLDKEAADRFRAAVLDDRELIVLLDRGEKEAKSDTRFRYTTATVILEERAAMTSAAQLDGLDGFGLSAAAREKVAADYTLTGEQRLALDHVTKDGGFAMIQGQAGTGKSQTMKAVRDAYEAEGFKTIGLSWTNEVAHAMEKAGFAKAATVSSALDLSGRQADAGRPPPADTWDAKTVILVDEAAQLSTHALATLMKKAAEQGAKVIAIGDDKQFAPIERGGMFTVLAREREHGGYGAATITEVQRIKDEDQRIAWKSMHGGDFRSALNTFNDQGCIHFANSQEGARDALISNYAEAVAAAPGKDRFIFAFTNDDVRVLNEAARGIEKEAGRLGEPHVLAATAAGPLEIATGDRIQMNTNSINRAERAAGIVKGAVGTVAAIAIGEDGRPIVTVRFDAGQRATPKEASFVVGADRAAGEIDQFSRGYAGTSYKGQGRSIDDTFVLHSKHWKASASYVSLTRHRESATIFAARETINGADQWMMEKGGFDALKSQHQESARQSYDVWAEEKPKLAARYNIGSYVKFVQDKWAEDNKGKSEIDRLADLMGRDDLKRAATGFEIDPATYLRSGLANADLFDRKAAAAKADAAAERGADAARPAEAVKVPAGRTSASAARNRAANDQPTHPAVMGPQATATRIMDGVAKAAEKALDGIADLFEGFIAPDQRDAPTASPRAAAAASEPPPLSAHDEAVRQAEEARKAHMAALATLWGSLNHEAVERDLADDERNPGRERTRGR